MDLKLSPDEAALLKWVLSQLVVKRRTGEVGIIHGMDRFVSTNRSFRRPDLATLDSVAQKAGLASGIKRYEG